MAVDGDLVKAVLAQASLTAEQPTMFDLLLSIVDDDDPDGEDRTPVRGAGATELAALRQVNATLAAALGACPLCWGDDECDACEGGGRPGYVRPDPELFDELVVPAIARMRRTARPARPGRHAIENR